MDAKNKADISLTVTELLRLRRWFQAYAQDAATLEPADVMLDSKLRTIRYDMQDRSDARMFAVRNAESAKQYVGPERRNRGLTARKRIIRSASRHH